MFVSQSAIIRLLWWHLYDILHLKFLTWYRARLLNSEIYYVIGDALIHAIAGSQYMQVQSVRKLLKWSSSSSRSSLDLLYSGLNLRKSFKQNRVHRREELVCFCGQDRQGYGPITVLAPEFNVSSSSIRQQTAKPFESIHTHTFRGARNRTLISTRSLSLSGECQFFYSMANSAGASRVNQLVELAKATFSQAKHEPGFTEHLEKLKKFVSTCTSSIATPT